MKVLFTFPGLAHYLNAQLRKLAEKSIDVAAIVPFKKSESMGSGVHTGNKAEGFRLIEGIEKKGFLSKPRFSNLSEILQTEKPDILVIGWPYALDLIFNKKLLRTIKQLNIALIYKGIPFNLPKRTEIVSYYMKGEYAGDETIENYKPKILGLLKFFIITLFRGMYLRKVDAHVYYIDEAIDIVKSYGVPEEKIFITYNAPDTDLHLDIFEKIQSLPKILPENNHRIIHVGRLVKWKRVDLLIEASIELRKKYNDFELIIVGSGPELENLKKQAESYSFIQFTGAIYDGQKLGQYLNESSVYVLAGMGGLSINEAMCYAKPIICTRADGTEKQMVRENINGYFFENGKLDSLIDKIDSIISDPTKCTQMGKASLDIIKNEMNLNTVADRYIKAFNYVLNQR
jgi:glycosyltransferase involved in cell wall biosynthesis